MNKVSIYLKALGCRLNEAELSQWALALQQKGFSIAAEPEQADCFVVNTCAVTQEAVRKSRQTIRQLQKKQPNAKAIASGCYVSLSPEEAEALGLDLVLHNKDKALLVEKIAELTAVPTMPMQQTTDWASGIFSRGRSRAFIKAQDGCRYQCTFCIVTHARGDEVSKPIDKIIEEINQYHAAGIQEVIISGVHLGGYGRDIGSSLGGLLLEVLNQTAVPRIRLGSVEPWGLDASFFECFANPRMMPHLHLPLQSGSDAILKKMARRCKRNDFLGLVEKAQVAIPNLRLSTDIIVGFPGETDADFAQTLSAMTELPLLHAHIFPFSPREGTRAATYDGQVDKVVKKTRIEQLNAACEKQSKQQLAALDGDSASVLWEQKTSEAADGIISLHGHTEHFVPVSLPVQQHEVEKLRHTISRVALKNIAEWPSKSGLLAERVSNDMM